VFDSYVEFRVTVSYGPVYGGHPSDIRRQLDVIAAESYAQDREVFHFTRHELHDTAAVIAQLTERVDDAALSFALRKQAERTLNRLQDVVTPGIAVTRD
jgi:BMFP domain-containing protein YqiC